MEFLLIIPIGLYMLFFIPAFMFTWEGSVFEGIGCYGWVCMIIGFPGAVLALLIKGVFALFKLPGQIKAEKEQQIRIQQAVLEEQKLRQQQINNEKAYKEHLNKVKNVTYPNSKYTKEIVDIITAKGECPYSIEVKSNGLTIRFENFTQNYIFRAHQLPDMDENEEKIFAEVLNDKLNNKYCLSEMVEVHNFKHSDGTYGDYTTHSGTRMSLKVTKSF